MLPTNKPASIEAFLMIHFALPYKECRTIVSEASTNIGQSASWKFMHSECKRLAEARLRKKANNKLASARKLQQNNNHDSMRTASTVDSESTVASPSWQSTCFVASKSEHEGSFCPPVESMVILGIAYESWDREVTSTTDGCDSDDIYVPKQSKDLKCPPKSAKQRQSTGSVRKKHADIPHNIYLLQKKSPSKLPGFVERVKKKFSTPVRTSMKAAKLDEDGHGNTLVNL